ncbi:RAD23D [Symbiodinium sp. CCMP2592]|nr:RAD23D [Symbiodinium sp. CCMP2592]
MKLQVKPLKGEAFDLDVEPGTTVEVLKAMVFARKPEMPPEQQKILHKGKVLQDEQTLEERGVADGDFVVIMTAKPKEEAAPPPPAAVPETASASPAAPVAPPAQPEAPAAAPAAPAAVAWR